MSTIKTSDPSVSKTGLSLPQSVRAAGDIEANERFGGNFSRYVQALIRQDVSHRDDRLAALSKLTPKEREALFLNAHTSEAVKP